MKDKYPLLEAFSKIVAERRKSLNLTQTELAEAVDLHRTYISDIERGARNPTLKTLKVIADGLKMNVSDLLERAETFGGAMLNSTT